MWRLGFCVVVAATLGCRFPDLPLIEEDASIDAVAIDASPCIPDNAECVGDISRVCGSDGLQLPDEMCWLGCRGVTGRCERLAASNSLDTFIDLGRDTGDLDLRPSAVIDVDMGVITVAGIPVTVGTDVVPAGTDAAPIRVFYARSFQIGTVTITGVEPTVGLGNALALVSPGPIRVSDVIDVSANASVNGPGVPLGHFGDDNFTGGDLRGAGGGGFGSDGGAGGLSTESGQDPARLDGAVAFGSTTLEPLRGGSRGGVNQDTFGYGGAGGAIQLSSETSVAILASAGIDAGGAGAISGGGGSGGGILLEAPTVIVDAAFIAANGGGGGSRCISGRGEDGRRDAMRAAGHPGCTERGAGGAGTSSPFTSAGAGTAGVVGGSGGGGTGRVVIRTRGGAFVTTNGGVVSPPAEVASTRLRP